MKTTNKSCWFVGTALALTLVPSMVLAQTAPTGPMPSADATTADTTANPGLAEIIVTAQRRSENIQNIPISVNALNASQLSAKGGTTSEDLTNLVPALVFNTGAGGGQFTIRGIGGTNSGVDPGNAVYVDGVYQYSPQANLFYFNAIDRIEVLKGPQGTLFGRNAAGGLLQVVTRDPSTAKASGEAQIGYANYNTISGNVYLNVPLTSNLAFNVAAFGFDQQDGWGHSVSSGHEIYKGYAWGVRAKLKWTAPDEDTDITLAAVYSRDKPVGFSAGFLPPGMKNVLGEASSNVYDTPSSTDAVRTDRQFTISGTIHHDLGFAKLTSITAYDAVVAPAVIDAVLTSVPILNLNLHEAFYTVSQEIHLESKPGQPLQWIAGFYFLHDGNPVTNKFGPFPPTTSHVELTSYAGFGEANYAIDVNTKFTAGLRYTDDSSTLSSTGIANQSTHAGKLTWRLALDHKFSRDILAYASYSRGFKSGLFNGTAPSKGAAAPESLDAYEVGIKSESFDHRLRINAAAFYYRFNSVQVQLFENASAYIANAGNAWSRGVDLDVAAEPVPGLTLTASLSATQTKFTSDIPNGNPPTCYTVAPIGAVGTPCSLVGKRLPFAPKFTGGVGATYKVESAIGAFQMSANYSHNSGYFSDPTNFAPAKTPAFDMINLSLNWTSRSEMWNASIWGKNMLDQHVLNACNVGVGFGSISICYPSAPRTFGGTIGVKF